MSAPIIYVDTSAIREGKFEELEFGAFTGPMVRLGGRHDSLQGLVR